MRGSWLSASLLLAVCGAGQALALEISWVGSLATTSDYTHRGLSQSSGKPAVQAGGGLRIPQGVYASAWASTINTSRLAPDFGDGEGYEVDAILGLRRPLAGDWDWQLDGGYYKYLELNSILDYDHKEFTASIGYRDLFRVSAAWSPDATDHLRPDPADPARGRRRMEGNRQVYELAAELPLVRWLTLSAGGGYNDLSQVSEVSYFFWSAGVNARHGRYALALTGFGADRDARRRFADGRADSRFVASLMATFGSP